MILNFITRLQSGANCIDPCRMFTEVNDLRVSDMFRAIVDLSPDGPNGPIPYPLPDDADVTIYIERALDPSVGVAVQSTHYPEQQALLVQFECYGKKYAIWTEMPLFCMNDSGKTIKAYHPVRT